MNQPLAYIHPGAKIATNVVVEPFTTIHNDVIIGSGTWIGSNVTIMEGARIGKNCRIFPGAIISAIPQDLKFDGEDSVVVIGDNTTIRECVTVNRGTKAFGRTQIGENCLIMATSHVAHDCVIGDNCILANGSIIAGHVIIGDFAILSGLVAVHQFIPANAMTTNEAESLNGSIGNLKNDSTVAIVPSKMPITPKLKINTKLKQEAEQAINRYSPAVRGLFTTAPQARNSFSQLFTVYVNKKIVAGDLKNLYKDFIDFVENRKMTDSMREKISVHLNAHKEGVIGAFKIWIALYNLKQDVVEQLDKAAKSSPIKGYLDDGTETQEGFVSHNLKFVNRMGFARQNLAARS